MFNADMCKVGLDKKNLVEEKFGETRNRRLSLGRS